MPRKKSASKAKPSSKKPVTAMYPKPERWTYRLDDPDVMSIEDRRMDLMGRLEAATKALREIVLPHYGERPDCYTPEQWDDRREKGLSPPPKSAPSEAMDAFNGLRTINHIRGELRALRGDPAAADRSKIGGQPDAAFRLACWAIDLGLLLQRCDAQLSFGSIVSAGEADMKRRSAEKQTKETERECLKSEAKNRYYVLREHFGGDETKALKAMAGCSWGQKAKNPADQTQRKNEEGVYETVNKWPSKSTLYKWNKEW